jgi:hypothetical protein
VLFIAPHRSLTPLDLKRRLTEAGTISGARRLSISDVVSRLQTNVGIEAADEAIRAETARVVTVGNGGVFDETYDFGCIFVREQDAAVSGASNG